MIKVRLAFWEASRSGEPAPRRACPKQRPLKPWSVITLRRTQRPVNIVAEQDDKVLLGQKACLRPMTTLTLRFTCSDLKSFSPLKP